MAQDVVHLHIPIQAIAIQAQVQDPVQAHLVVQGMLKVAQVLVVAQVQEVAQAVGLGHLVRYLIIRLSVIKYPASAV